MQLGQSLCDALQLGQFHATENLGLLQNKATSQKQWVQGAMLTACSAVLFSLANAAVKCNPQVSVIHIGFLRCLVSITLAMPFKCLYSMHLLPQTDRKTLVCLMLRSFGDFVCSCMIFYIVCHRLSLGVATMISMTTPFWTALIAKLWLREEYAPRDLFIAAVAFLGVYVGTLPTLKAAGSNNGQSFMIIVALMNSFCNGSCICLTRRISWSCHPVQMQFAWGMCGVTLIAILSAGKALGVIVSVAEKSSITQFLIGEGAGGSKELSLALLSAILATSGQVVLYISLMHIEARFSALVRMLEMPMALIWQFVFTGSVASQLEIFGAVLVSISCFVAALTKQMSLGPEPGLLENSTS